MDSIRVHLPTQQHVVILKERHADRYLPIWIGNFEANAIAMKIQGVTPDRPITHDLVRATFGVAPGIAPEVFVPIAGRYTR